MKSDPPSAFKTACVLNAAVFHYVPTAPLIIPSGVMKWSFETHHVGFYGSTAIDSEGTIYVIITRPVNGIYLMDARILPFCKPVIIGKITIQVEATLEPFGIDRVALYIDDTLKAIDTEAPYEWTWSTPAFFKHSIRTIAYNASGNSAWKSIDVWKLFLT